MQPSNDALRAAWLALGLAVLAALLPTSAAQSTPGFNCVNVTTNCSDHADSVDGGYINQYDQRVCNCTCRNYWTGERCEKCATNYNASEDCGTCAFGYIDYPNCTSDACTQADCSNHAAKVSGYRTTGCTCDCVNQFRGDICNECPSNYFDGGTCGSCADGFNDYPNCYPECNVMTNCSGNADRVSGNLVQGCDCQCSVSWTGKTCDVCPHGYEQNSCAQCIPDYGPAYPQCDRLCTVVENCTAGFARAFSVTGLWNESCDCRCKNQWAVPNCSTCPHPYTGSQCNLCKSGYTNYPLCVQCTVNGNCSGRAADAKYNESTKQCTCIDCRNGYQGAQCQTCPLEYGPPDCAACNTAAGFVGSFPDCDRQCTNANACSNHASSVSGTFKSGCVCACEFKWEGQQCEICPEKYDALRDCNACASDRESDFPVCTPLPTTTTTAAPTTQAPPTVNPNQTTTEGPSVDPSNTTTAAPGNNTPAPTGTPAPTPENNNTEPSKSVPEEPSKTPAITPSKSITINVTSTHTFTENASVSTSLTASKSGTVCYGDAPTEVWSCMLYNNTINAPPINCHCQCRNAWTGSRCEICELRFNRSEDCGNCSAGYHFYPTCDYGVFIHGNWSYNLTDRALLPALLRGGLLDTVSYDATAWVRNLSCSNASNVSGFALRYIPGDEYFEFDFDVLDPSPSKVWLAVTCIERALSRQEVAPLRNTTALIEKLFPGKDISFRLANASYNASERNPCPGWCRAGAPPADPPGAPGSFPFWVIVIALVVVLCAAAIGAILYRRHAVLRAKMHRSQLKERLMGKDEVEFCDTEMAEQAILPGGRAAPGTDRTGSRLRRRANAPPTINSDDV